MKKPQNMRKLRFCLAHEKKFKYYNIFITIVISV